MTYLSIAGGTASDPKFRVVKVNGTVSESMAPRISRYAVAVGTARDVSRILGVPLILPTHCPVCGDTADWCDILADRPNPDLDCGEMTTARLVASLADEYASDPYAARSVRTYSAS